MKAMFGHRSDGHLVSDIDPIVALTPYIMPMRCDAQVMSDYKIDFEKLARYIVAKADEGYKITFMEIVIAAYVRVVSQIPEVNRFVANKRLYARNELAVSFALLQNTSTGKIAENTTKCKFDPSDTIYDVADRISETVERCRKEEADNSTMKVARLLLKPILANSVVGLARLLDRYGIMPRYILEASPFHTSLFVTNLASIGLPAVNHHIYNFGTCSQFVSIGSVERTMTTDAKGNAVRKRLLPLGLVCDERIAEGAMYAKMMALWVRLLNDPEQLETPPANVFYDEGHEFHLPPPQKRMGKVSGAAVQA
ncbi:MAG: 2-oxo acid dehydrogenase subunit E2 [Clostridia bacterium]|nr:2-oxo acid dehydrogenase subunit E2 [Clostridia bacterium]